MLVILLFLSTLIAFSSPKCEESVILPLKTNDLTQVLDQVLLPRPSDEEIMNARCKTKSAPSLKEMESFINGNTSLIKTEIINGVSIKNESPIAIEAFKDLTTNKDFFFNTLMKENQTQIQSKYSINPSCAKALCAVKKIWGDELGTKILYLKMRYGINSSELAYSDEDMTAERFKIDEIDDIIMAIADLPKDYQSLFKNKPIIHMVLKKDIPTNIANASIIVFNKWVEQSRAQRQFAIYHELIHNISSHKNEICESKDWRALSGWSSKNNGKSWEYDLEKECFATNYAKKNSSEDFAESATVYRYAPEKFKEKCPKKYQFIKNKLFNNIEYTTDDCK
ncbi:MAG: hypothetical protein ACOVP4_05090 [Bacteriovoracaceae bacterium]